MTGRLSRDATVAAPGDRSLDGATRNPDLPWGVIAFFTCLAGTLALYATAPLNGDFWWSEAPRNALNGAFIVDFIREFPIHDPVGWAYRYYDRYPALTIFFYPPIFYVFLAVAYALFGVSHAVAQGVESAFVLVAALGAYAVARRFVRPAAAIGVALALAGAPELGLWGRQVMLEAPALAFMVWAAHLTLRYSETGRRGFIYGAVALALAAIYARVDSAFIFEVIMIALYRMEGRRLLRNKHLWIASALFTIGLIPIVVMQLYFGAANVTTVGGENADADLHPATHLESWYYYIGVLPRQLGWVPAFAVAAAVGAWAILPDRRAVARKLNVPVVWFVFGYFFYGLISLKEPRHTIPLLFPLIVFAFVWIERVSGRWAAYIPPAFGVGVLAATVFFFPAPAVNGYREAADYIAANAPRDGLVMFSGLRDGSFIFNLRTHGDRRDLAVWRADKLLLDVAVMRQRGIREIGLDEESIRRRVRDAGVSYVVAQDGFWTDLGVMRRFETVVNGEGFEVAKRIPVTGDSHPEETGLTIYRVTGPLPPRTQEPLNTPSITKTVPKP